MWKWVLGLVLWASPCMAESVLVVVIDDADPEHLRLVGSSEVLAPTLEKVRDQALYFPAVWSSSRCAPSLDQLLTGKRPHQSGRTYNSTNTLPDVDPNLSVVRLFADRGYRTFLAGKFWHGCIHDWGFEAGFDWNQPWDQLGRVTQQPVFDWLSALDPQEDFFLYWAPKMPHLPHDPPVSFIEAQAPSSEYLLPEYVDPCVEPTWRREERIFRSMLTWFDDELRKLGKHLRMLGREDSTTVLIVNDNGWTQGIVGKGFCGRKAIEGPVWLSGSGVTPGVFGGMLYLEDFHGVLASLAAGQLEIPGPRGELVRACYPGNHDLDAASAVFAITARDERYKLDWFTRDVLEPDNQSLRITYRLALFPTRLSGEVRMYDLVSDPFELTDVAGTPGLEMEQQRLMMLAETLYEDLLP